MKKLLLSICLLLALCFVLTGCKPIVNAEFVRTYYTSDGENNKCTIVRSTKELDDYHQTAKNVELLNKDAQYARTIEKYDSAFFEKNLLVAVVLIDPSGSIRHKVSKASIVGNTLLLEIQDITPVICTDDMAEWTVFLELSKEYETIDEVKVERIAKGAN